MQYIVGNHKSNLRALGLLQRGDSMSDQFLDISFSVLVGLLSDLDVLTVSNSSWLCYSCLQIF